MDLVLINNYSMQVAYDLWQKGESGSHHVWGKVELEKKYGINVILFEHLKYPILNYIGKRLGIKFLDQQIRLFFWKRRDYVLYLPYASSNSKLLLLLKWMGIYNVKIVSLIHQPFLGTKSDNRLKKYIARRALSVHDAVIFLSERMMYDTISALDFSHSLVGAKFFTAHWGPDRNFYQRFRFRTEGVKYFISAGHTDRDYDTLVESFRGLNYPLVIYCTESSKPNIQNIPSNVTIHTERIPYIKLLQYYAESIAILIPLKFDSVRQGCQGMTSLQDVLALSKATIITRNDVLSIDVEVEGFGFWVEMYDIYGWKERISQIANNPQLRLDMGNEARRVYESYFNSDVFAATLANIFKQIYYN